jgi:hypothetical protein
MNSELERRESERRIPQPADGWHLDKKVPIGLIIGMVAQVVVGAWWVTSQLAEQRKDIELIKADVIVLHQRDNQSVESLREAMRVMQDQFQRLDGKLDRLIERSSK